MMMKGLVLTAFLGLSLSVSAADINGVNRLEAQQIVKKYGNKIDQFESNFLKEISKFKHEEGGQPSEALSKERQDILDGLTKEDGYLFADLQPVFYQDKQKFFFTLDLVDKHHPERLRFVTPKSNPNSQAKKGDHKPDLIDAMIKYTEIGFDLMRTEPSSINVPCPVLHCTFGFEAPRLKPYLTTFNEGVIKEKALILKTLNKDPSPDRRGAAVFLVGHFKDPKEIISVLTPYVTDQNDLIRNNAMRVIGETMSRSPKTPVDMEPFIEALSSPYLTDRNKALLVLLNMMGTDEAKQKMLEKGGDQLLALLRLKQPNNHDFSYQILKIISGKDFGPMNYSAWSRWVFSAKKQLA